MLLSPAAALAQATQADVIVTATRLSQGVTAADSQVTVFDQADIDARSPDSAAELLRSAPDIYVQQAGGRGSVTSIFLRGAKPNFSLVLIDGVEVNDPTNTRGGSYDFANLDLDDLARVEVVRGPTSAVYGSGAVGGVINFMSSAPSKALQGDAEASIGGFGYWSAAAHLGGAIGPAATRVGVSYVDNGAPVEGSGYRGLTFTAGLSAALSPETDLRVAARFGASQAQAFPDSSGGPEFATIRSVDHRNSSETTLAVHLDRRFSPLWSATLDYGLFDRSGKARSPGVAPSAQDPSGIPPNTDNVSFIRHDLTVVGKFQPDARFNAAVGLNLRYEHGVDDGTLDFGGFTLPTRFDLTRRQWGAFGEAHLSPTPSIDLAASLRYDNFGNAGDRFDPKLSAGYVFTATGTRLEASWAKGFKLPSFYALGNPIVGDPSLKSEAADDFELGVSQPLPLLDSRFKLTGFDTDYTNLIDFNPGPVPKLVNLPGVKIKGVEASVALQVNAEFSLEGHVSYITSRDVQTGAALRDVPRWLAGGTITWAPTATATLLVDVVHVGSLIDNAIPTGDERLPGHQQVDLVARWRVRPCTTLSFDLQNVFDRRYQEVIGFPAPRAIARLGVKIDL